MKRFVVLGVVWGMWSAAMAQPIDPLRGKLEARVKSWKTCARPAVIKGPAAPTDIATATLELKACLETVKASAGSTEAEVEALKARFDRQCKAVPMRIKALAARPDPCATRPERRAAPVDATQVLKLFQATARHIALAKPAEAVELTLAAMATAQDFTRFGPLIDNVVAVAAYDLVHTPISRRVHTLPAPALARLEAGLDHLLSTEPPFGEMLANEADSIIAFRLAPSIFGPKWFAGDARLLPMPIKPSAQLGVLRLWARLDGFIDFMRNTCGPDVSVGRCELALAQAGQRFGTGETNDPLTGASSRFGKYLRKVSTRRAALAGLKAQVQVARGAPCPPKNIQAPGIDGPLRVEPGKSGWLLEVPASLGDIRVPIALVQCQTKYVAPK
jgi:hypothetical protein